MIRRASRNRPRPGLLGAAAVACAWCSLFAQSAPEIPFTRYQLSGGLTVILHEDHRLPLVALNLWYYVGSKDEPPGRSGFAHLFEHLMFMGTQRVPYPQFDRIIEAAGGFNNATTSEDRTNYFDAGPRELLEKLIALEADRMAAIGPCMTREKLDVQREVVRNERRQRYENRPYGKARLLVPARIYPPAHPYHHPVIGSHEDLEKATLEDVKDFFAHFYHPGDASLAIAGDFEPEAVRSWVDEHFGAIPARPPPARRPAPEARIEGPLRETLEDTVEMPLLLEVWHSPAFYQEGDADMDVVAITLGGGKSSRLYRRLVHELKVANQVAARQSSAGLDSRFEIEIHARPEASLDGLEAELDRELEHFRREGPTAREVERARNRIDSAFWHEVEGLVERADLLNRYQFHFGDPGAITRDRARYEAVTAETAREWARRILRPEARLVLRVVPARREPAREEAAGGGGEG